MKTLFKIFNMIGLSLLVLLAHQSMAQQTNVVGQLGQSPTPNLTETGPILWNQIDVPGTGWIMSSEYTDLGTSASTCVAADDFYVPEGDSWDIGSIAFVGTFFDQGVGPVDTFNVIFYEDAPGMPGFEIAMFEDMVSFTYEEEDVNGYTVVTYQMKLPAQVSLDAGHYWMSVQAKGSVLEMGEWGWNDYFDGSPTPTAEQWHFKNPEDGLGTGFIDWTPAETVAAIFVSYDLTFALYEPSFENDLAMTEILSPLGGPGMTTTEPVTVVIKNEGTTPQSDYDVKFVFDGAEVIENVGSDLVNPNEFYEYTFTATVDMETGGPYDLEVYTMLADDEYTDNDMLDTIVFSYGTIYEMENGVTDATITACTGTSVDMGGIDNGFEQDDYGTVTFYPETAGSQVRLTFIEFDIDWGEMEFYDGETTAAPSFGIYDKGTGSPGVVTAFNETGALTMRFEASGWSVGPGWVAFISCFDPVEDDFAVLDISLSSNSIVAGEFVTAYATIQNYGTLTQGKDVTFTANGEEFGTVATGDLEPWEMIVLETEWNPEFMGSYTVIASVPDDDGIDNNNSQSLIQEIGNPNILEEGFENEEFPPEGWSVTTGWWERSESAPLFGDAHATAFNTPSDPDTLITPLLGIIEGDEFSFYAGGSWWWPGDLEIVYKEINSDWVSLLYLEGLEIPVSPTNYVIELDDYAGEDGYFGFVSHGNVSWWDIGEIDLDNISGPAFKSYVKNLSAFNLDGDQSPNSNEPTVYEFTVKNYGSEEQLADAYTVKLMDSEGTELLSMDGVDILPLQEITFEMEHTFTVTGPVTVYAVVDFEDDEQQGDNTSNTIISYVQQEGTQQTQVGDGIEQNWNFPVGTSGAYKIAEMLYLNDEIGLTGIMNGISFFYNSDEVLPFDGVPYDIYVGEILEDELPADTDWITSNDLELVFSGTLDFLPGDNMLYIPFDTPYSYGGDNLVIMTHKTDDLYYGSTYWYLHETEDMQTKWGSDYNFVPDPADPSPLYPHDEYLRPNARIYVLPPQGGYCEPQTVDGTDNGFFVDGVTLGEIENTGTGELGGSDYNDYTTMSTNLERERYYELTLDINTDGDEGTVAVWIDYNSDSDFDDEGEKVAQVMGEGDSFTVTVPIVVPEDVELGIKRMRVRAGDFTEFINACQTIVNGEGEDYLVNITETIQEFNPISDLEGSLDVTEVNLMWNVPVNPGQAHLESFEGLTWPPVSWEVKTSTSLTDPLTDPVDMTWEQTMDEDYVYNLQSAAYISEEAPDFNWLISPEFTLYGDDAISFGLYYSSNPGGKSKFYGMLEVDGEWMNVVEYTYTTNYSNHYDEKVLVDLSDYAGKQVRFAFVTEYNDGHPVAIDDAVVSSLSNLSEGFEGLMGYTLYKNGEMIAEITDPSEAYYTDIVDETENYTYCVVANYDANVSESVCTDVFYLAPMTPPVNLVAGVEGLDVHLNWTAPNAGIMRFNDDFESYTVGEQLATQNPDDWTTWSGEIGGAEDPYITDDMSYSGDQSVIIEGANDLLWVNDEALTSGHYIYNFKIYVPEDRVAYFNVLQMYEFGVGALWGFQAFFNPGGTGTCDAGGYDAASFTYEYEEWMYVEVDVDLDLDWGQFRINGELIHQWAWSTGIGGGGDLNELQAADFYAYTGNGTPESYVDDVSLMEVFETEDLLTYNVYRDGGMLENVTGTEYVDMELEPDTYEYYVTAVYDEGESDPSNVLNVTVHPLPYLPFFEDFDEFVAGEQLACQDPINWTTWSYLPCDPVEDAYISDLQSYSGDNSVVIEDDNDLVLAFEEYYTEGTYKISFMMYVPTDRDAYWNVLQDFAGGSSVWGLEVFFDGGTGSLSVDNTKTFDYDFDTWMLMELYVDLDEDGAQLFVDGQSVHFWNWTNGGVTQLAAMDFYGMSGFYADAEMYFDNMSIEYAEWTFPALPAPINLEAEVDAGDVHLTWIAPVAGDLIEIAYDDGTAEGTFWVSGNPSGADDMMGTRMTMPENGTVYEVALFTNTGVFGPLAFSDVIVCPVDGSGLPDIDNAYDNLGEQMIENEDAEWLTLSLNQPFYLDAGQEFFVISRWPAGNADGPFIGADNTTPPTEERNYYSSSLGVWNLIADYNFLIRSYYAPAGEEYNGKGLQIIPVENDGEYSLPGSSLTNPVVTEQAQSWKAPLIITSMEELMGYNVYRDSEMIGNTTEEMYDDMGLTTGAYEYYVTAVYDLGESNPSNVVLVDVIVGVDENALNGVDIYPNPVNDQIYIESNENITKVIVLNVNGQVVVEEDVTDQGTISIDVDDLKTGVYYLRLETTNGWINEKIIKK